jgi:hypothetical protein
MLENAQLISPFLASTKAVIAFSQRSTPGQQGWTQAGSKFFSSAPSAAPPGQSHCNEFGRKTAIIK